MSYNSADDIIGDGFMKAILLFPACSALVGFALFAGGAGSGKHPADGRGLAWNRQGAAAYLDKRTESWIHGMGAIDHGTFCVSCHTGLPYAASRGSLRAGLGERGLSATESELVASVTKRVRMWGEVQPFLSGLAESRGTESVLNALVLVTYDGGKAILGPDTQKALDIMWEQQFKTGPNSGAWPWFSLGNEPWEAPDSQYWGAALAATAIGSAPRRYLADPKIQVNVRLLKEYLNRGLHDQTGLNKLALLSASTKMPGLLPEAEQRLIITEVLAKQHSDGGWSAGELLGPTWRRHDGTPQDSRSDGYGTGFVAFTLEQAGLKSGQSELKRGLAWLVDHQDHSTGGWPGYSLNTKRDPSSDVGQFMNDAATSYAVLALTNGGL